ncbi:MAG: PqqD family protein [Ruminococcus sp.]|nr:PqqD family protein [Ruminococcus sp.]
MKIKEGFALRNFADKWIAVSINDNTHENNLFITLNNSGAFVWNLLQNEMSYDDVIKKITQKYDIDSKTAQDDFDSFLSKVRNAGILDE